MKRYLPVAMVAVLLAVDGYVHGLWTNRWRTADQELETASARVRAVPMSVGDWQGEDLTPLSDREVQQAGFAGYISRRYKNQQSGSTVNILLACGLSGPLAVHTPDVCYRGSGYEAPKGKAKHSAKCDDAVVEMWKSQFAKPNSTTAVKLHVSWSWSTNGSWQAPDNPRFTFAGAPVLHKFYVVQEVDGYDEQSGKACSEFLSQFLPELNSKLFSKQPDEKGV